MTDIAILVTEEFERSVSQSRKEVGSEGNEEMGLVSCVSELAQSLKKKIGEEKMHHFVNWVKKEPKTQIALAAYNGFFSA